MSDSGHDSDRPLSQFSIEDDEVVWRSDTDFIVLRHPLLNAHSLPSTASDFSEHPGSDNNLSSALDNLSLCDQDSSADSCSTGTESVFQTCTPTSSESEYHTGASTPTASYDDASTFISHFISSPVEGSAAQLDLLRALIIELGLRSPNASDLPCTITSARKLLKSEAHVNIKEYVMTRHKGQSALREILKPSKNALRKDIKKGKGVSLRWVKQHGLQVLLVTCFTA